MTLAPAGASASKELDAQLRLQQRELVELLEEKKRRKRMSASKMEAFTPWPKQQDFCNQKAKTKVLFGGNRVGKTITGAFIVACHATGIYPAWWEGYRFDAPPDIWCAGITAQSTRDIIQKELFGDITNPDPEKGLGSGMIPGKLIVGYKKLKGTNDTIDVAYVKHASGGVTSVGLKSTEQGRAKFQGTGKQLVWLDEEAERDAMGIYSESLLRTMEIEGAQVLITFTPLQGQTPLYRHLYYAETKSIWSTTITWDDAPHLSEEEKAAILASTPEYEHEARKFGRPLVKEGLVFPFTMSSITAPPVVVGKHWSVIQGMDIGWQTPTTCPMLAQDPSTGTWYVVACYAKEGLVREKHAKAILKQGPGVRIECDPSARRTEGDGKKAINVYRDLGLNIYKADNSVKEGVTSMYEAFASGELKICSNLKDLIEEIAGYMYEKNEIKKVRDHRIDGVRYAWMGRHNARPLGVFMAQHKLKEKGHGERDYLPASYAGY